MPGEPDRAAGPPPRRFGIADVHAFIALACATTVLVVSGACCLDPIHKDAVLAATVACLVATVWSSAFALVTRGSRISRLAVWTALAMIALAAFLTLIASRPRLF